MLRKEPLFIREVDLQYMFMLLLPAQVIKPRQTHSDSFLTKQFQDVYCTTKIVLKTRSVLNNDTGLCPGFCDFQLKSSTVLTYLLLLKHKSDKAKEYLFGNLYQPSPTARCYVYPSYYANGALKAPGPNSLGSRIYKQAAFCQSLITLHIHNSK